MAGEKGDCGMSRRRGVRADLGAGLANGDGGMAIRGDSGRVFPAVLALLEKEAALWSVDVLCTEVVESYEVLRDNAAGGLVKVFSADASEALSNFLSWKLKRALVLVGAGLNIAGDMLFFKKSR